MALVQRTHIARLRFRDNDQAESTCECNLPAGTSLPVALLFLPSWRGLVEALSSAVCIESDLLVRWTETAPSGGTPDADNTRQAVFIFSTADDSVAAVYVPSIRLDLLRIMPPFVGIAVDLDLVEVQAFGMAMMFGIDGTQPCDPFGLDLVELTTAYRQQM